MFSLVILVRGMGGKLSRLVYLAPAQDLGHAVSSVNSYCTIILEYLVVRDVNIISDSQTEMFTSNVQFSYPCPRGGRIAVQAGLSCPPPRNGQTLSSVNSYCTIILEYSVVRDVNISSVKLRCLHLTFSLVTLVRGVGGKMSRLLYLAARPGFGSGSVISQFLLHSNLGIFSCKRYKHYFSQIDMLSSNIQFGYPCPRGGGAKCPGWFILPPAQDLGQALSSVNSYCTIILEYLVVRDINIILVKLTCFHPTFSWVTLVQGVGSKMSRLVYILPPSPAQDLGQAVSSVNSNCTIILEYLVVRDINIISVKLKCFHPTISLVTLVRGVGAKMSRLVYLAHRPGFGSRVSSVNSYCTIILVYLVA